MVKRRYKNLFSKLIILLVIAMNTGFTLAVLYIFRRVGSEPTALIAAWFGFTTGELWMLSNIKKTKIKNEVNINDETRCDTKINEP